MLCNILFWVFTVCQRMQKGVTRIQWFNLYIIHYILYISYVALGISEFRFISGPDLLFVIYPLGLSRLPSPAVWSFLFFLMVFTLGIDSQVIHRILRGRIQRVWNPWKITNISGYLAILVRIPWILTKPLSQHSM